MRTAELDAGRGYSVGAITRVYFQKGLRIEIPHSWPAAPQIVISLQENGCIMASSILAGLTVASVGGPPAPRVTLATTGNVRK